MSYRVGSCGPNWQRESCAVTEVLRRAFPIADLGRILGLIGSLQPVRELIWVRIGIFQLFQDRQVAVGRRPRLFRVRGDDDAQPLRGPAERQVHLPVRYGGVPCWIMPIYHERRPPVAASGALYRHNVQSIPHGGRSEAPDPDETGKRVWRHRCRSRPGSHFECRGLCPGDPRDHRWGYSQDPPPHKATARFTRS